jgi:hypothetical protein
MVTKKSGHLKENECHEGLDTVELPSSLELKYASQRPSLAAIFDPQMAKLSFPHLKLKS